ncbi:HAMP domain-containing sensor histidine kinase [Desulfovibrio sp. JC022]|uniref:HAMP domain-containing sensor histidine kinase n=1 Tax=Desulfovibrio sp. JC022 TaxID=2593642 RepID=UPI0013D18BD7|nr:HAMP domain-containing sensor histidine kinase [Desulfovibrio sp. JC022]NDV22831.1 HAMP domain-containing histidine kinase [Desulfovibrio sp. JC022]
MKISRIYLKFFLSFMLVLIVSELAIFGLLHMSWEQSPRVNHMERQIFTVKDLAEMELGTAHLSPEYERKILTPLLKTLGNSLQADIWITGPYGEIVASSGSMIPDMSKFKQGETAKTKSGAYVYKKRNDGMKSVYGVYTAQLPVGYPFTYHLFHSFRKFDEEIWFMRAQIVLTIIAAIFLIPVSRRVIRPLRKLTASASRMGKGDLKQRVEIKGKDEVAELGQAFNNMAEGLEKMVKSSRELTANVSHELRSPLARMRISLEMLKERIEDGNTSGCDNFINGMQSEITHMDKLIGRIIEFSKLDMQKRPALNETADLKGLIVDLLEQYKYIADRNNLNVTTELAELKLPNCNRNGIRIIMDNILGNAFKYTDPEGTISVDLDEDGDNVCITVTNTHAPLLEEDLEEIFNPFHRLKAQEIPGSGLGLAAARKLVRIHGGTIKAENSAQGFKIIMTIPTKQV